MAATHSKPTGIDSMSTKGTLVNSMTGVIGLKIWRTTANKM